MYLRRSLTATALTALFCLPASASTLYGSTVTMRAYYPTATILQSNSPTATVGDGVEFPDGVLHYFEGGSAGVDIDIKSSSFELTSRRDGVTHNFEFDGFTLTFAGAPAILNVSVNPLSDLVPPSSAVTYTANSFSLNGSGLAHPAGAKVLLDLTLAPVPEPATAAMLAIGLLAIFGWNTLSRHDSESALRTRND